VGLKKGLHPANPQGRRKRGARERVSHRWPARTHSWQATAVRELNATERLDEVGQGDPSPHCARPVIGSPPKAAGPGFRPQGDARRRFGKGLAIRAYNTFCHPADETGPARLSNKRATSPQAHGLAGRLQRGPFVETATSRMSTVYLQEPVRASPGLARTWGRSPAAGSSLPATYAGTFLKTGFAGGLCGASSRLEGKHGTRG